MSVFTYKEFNREELPVKTSATSVAAVLDDTEFLPISRRLKDDDGQTYKTRAAREIDDVLRTVCMVDDEGKGVCSACPYREFFFGEDVGVGEDNL